MPYFAKANNQLINPTTKLLLLPGRPLKKAKLQNQLVKLVLEPGHSNGQDSVSEP
jgi:hypothetical protein